MTVADTAFDTGLLGQHCWLELTNGERIGLPVQRWRHERPESGDELMLTGCTGPTLDIGCGPGRLVAYLTERGVPALGIDSSPVAVRLATQRGASALHRSVFDHLPGTGRWQHALLADGNIGIGGDPESLLCRVAELLAPGGTVLIEIEPPGSGLRQERVRVAGGPASRGDWFSWAWLGTDALGHVASAAGMRVGWLEVCGGRWFAELVHRPRALKSLTFFRSR